MIDSLQNFMPLIRFIYVNYGLNKKNNHKKNIIGTLIALRALFSVTGIRHE